MTDSTTNSDDAILRHIAQKLAARRIELELTQAKLAIQAGVSKHTIERLENGESVQLLNLVKTLRALGLLDRLIQLFPKRESPLAQLRQQQKKPRQRVRKKRPETIAKGKETWKWGE